MKKIIKKIGVLGIIIAMVIPFLEMPEVKAEDNCPKHLQNYLFLDYDSLDEYGDGYKTYALFSKTFAEGNVKVLSHKYYYINDAGEDNLFWKYYNQALSREQGISPVTGEKEGWIFTISNDSSKYEDITTLIHTKWAKYDANGNILDPENTDWNKNSSNSAITYQNASKDNSFIGYEANGAKGISFGSGNITLQAADWENNKFYANVEYDDLNEYIEAVANNETETFIPFGITRKFTTTQLNSLVFGIIDNSGNKKIYGTKGSFSEYLNRSNSSTLSDPNGNINIYHKIGNETLKYYWPFILSVEYEVCSNDSSEETWTLAYDYNTSDETVSNKPNSQSADLGKPITVSSTTPKRTGYKFLKWCDDENGNGKCYTAGEEVESPKTSQTITLFAQWGSTKEGDPEKTGVMSYVIGFISVGIISGGLYILAKKKNLFKQI